MARVSNIRFVVAMGVMLSLVEYATSLRHRGVPRKGGKGAVMYFDAQRIRQKVIVSRQNHAEFTGSRLRYSFTEQQLHKEYVVETQATAGSGVCEQPVFVKGSNAKMCSTGLFTTRRLNCHAFPAKKKLLNQALQHVRGLEPPTDRGIGLEFEFVARELTEEAKTDMIRALESESHQMNLRPRETDEADDDEDLEELFSDEEWEWLDGLFDGDYDDLDDWLVDDYDESFDDEGEHILAVKSCFQNITQHAERASTSRLASSLKRWNWEYDGSVVPLTDDEAKLLGAHPSETKGVAFEVTSPGPPHVLSGTTGFQSFNSVVFLLKKMGIQAGPSQGLHVHVNVMNKKAPGKLLTHAQIANVWAAYAKYQLVIDEMLSPSRPSNTYANRLFLGSCPEISSGKCESSPCGCVRRLFSQLHSWVHSRRTGSNLNFCNSVLKTPGYQNPCGERYPHQRYFQLNLVPLSKFGTIEFRAHSATYDQERISRWVQFLVAFVEHFGHGRGSTRMAGFFKSSSAGADYDKLRQAQRRATITELFDELGHLVNKDSASYFTSRLWERGDATCNLPGSPTVERPDCSHSGGGSQRTNRRVAQPVHHRVAQPAATSTSRPARRERHRRNARRRSVKVRVEVPDGHAPDSYLDVEMPGGDVHAVLVNKTAVENGYFEISYRPVASRVWRNRLRRRLRTF